MMSRLFAVVTAAAAVLVAATGCGSSSATETNEKAVAWSEQVCKTIEAGGLKLSQLPKVDPANPSSQKDGALGYLGTLVESLDGVANGIRAAGVPPVTDGQSTMDKALGTVDKAKASIEGARASIGKAPANDPLALQKAMAEAGGALQVASAEGPAKDLKANPELSKAFAESATCRKVGGANG
ncbi:hypothetical protein EV193_1114 [Herbihabitans rhizosphaerae]|uniref:Small secreted protein n=1 Tax=Herbihabitans rhizosphaerae TaxID=1872711 RepID=A0A4Q7KIA4_9PSEU|nr:hypothetical protein [Herbihabitans rhizosphaerae]RZS32628.1 hypothetical protein EV193_1114 [Herbihabitans rhizosphaerae]